MEQRGVWFTAKDGRRVLLRSLAKGDVGAMTRFANALVREKKANRGLGVATFDKRVDRKTEAEFLGKLVTARAKREGANCAAFAEGEMVGECTLNRRPLADFRHTGVLGIVVLAGYRGVGLGERLMAEVLRDAVRMGVWLVELDVVADNGPAIRLYEKLGFRRVGTIPNKVLRDGKHGDIVAMYADLRGTDKSIFGRRGPG